MTTSDRARLPYFQFYAGDFLASGKVALMEPHEGFAHVLLMCQAWLSTPPASVPDDDYVLAKWARMSIEQWRNSRPRVLSAWELIDGRWVQPRLREEWEKAIGAKVAQIEGGRKGGQRSAQGRVKGTSSQPSRVPQAFSEAYAESESDNTKTKTVAAIVGESDQRQEIVNLIVGCGIPAMKAIELARNPWLTPERLDYIIKLAVKSIPSGDRRGFIIAGIRDRYEADPTNGKVPEVAEYKPMPSGVWGKKW